MSKLNVTMAVATLAMAAAVTLRAQSFGGRGDFNPSTRAAGGVSPTTSTAESAAGATGGPTGGATTRSYGGYGNYNGGGNNNYNRDTRDYGRTRDRGSSRDSGRSRDRNGFRSNSPTTSKTLDGAYALVLSKSIFAKNRRTTDPTDRSSRGGDVVVYPPSPMVFNGVVEVEEGVTVAFVEDTGGGGIRQYHLGDTVGKGKITGLTLDTMEIETDGKKLTVHVGQTLQGTDAPSLMDRASSSWGGGWNGGGSSQSSSPSPTPPGPDSDIIAKLKARRAAQTGGGGTPPPGGSPGGAPGQPPR